MLPPVAGEKPASEKVSPCESHRVEEDSVIRVYHYVDSEWRLDPKENYPAQIDIVTDDVIPCKQPVAKESVDTHISFTTPTETSDVTDVPLDKIQRCAILSDLAYSNVKDLFHQPDGFGVEKKVEVGFPIHFNHSLATQDCQCYMWKFAGERTVYIAFRGTSALSDVVSDLVGMEINGTKVGMAHQVFLTQFQALESLLRHQLDLVDSEYDELVCTGHSLGGACALIASPTFAQVLPSKRVSCITFGAPRAGDGTFGDWHRDKVSESIRVVNVDDPVPLLPLGDHYTETTVAVSLHSDGSMHGLGKRNTGSELHLSFPEILYHLTKNPAHNMSEYCARIDKAISARGSGGRRSGA